MLLMNSSNYRAYVDQVNLTPWTLRSTKMCIWKSMPLLNKEAEKEKRLGFFPSSRPMASIRVSQGVTLNGGFHHMQQTMTQQRVSTTYRNSLHLFSSLVDCKCSGNSRTLNYGRGFTGPTQRSAAIAVSTQEEGNKRLPALPDGSINNFFFNFSSFEKQKLDQRVDCNKGIRYLICISARNK